MRNCEFDTVILGGGPAGLSAGLYVARGRASVAIVDVNMFGGQPSNYLDLENYLGFFKIKGFELVEKFEQHAESFGVQKFPMQELVSIDLVSTPKIIQTKELEIRAKSVIIATGASPKKLQIVGEDEFLGRGVSYCAICDGAFFKDKIVGVVGGGNSAIEEAIYLTNFASKVYIIHRREELRADKIIQQRALNNEKIEIIYNSLVCEIAGKDRVEEVVLKNVNTSESSKLKLDGIFPYIGISPNVSFVNGQVAQDNKGFILTDETMKTSQEGVFAVGDVRNTPLRQVITAVSDGAVAGVYAVKYLDSMVDVKVL
jgi:thioredoxin reductase (NADPH)